MDDDPGNLTHTSMMDVGETDLPHIWETHIWVKISTQS